MCEVCAIFGAGEHWSDFGRLRNEQFPFADIQHYRRERQRRVALINDLLRPLTLTCEDWDGEALVLYDAQGRSHLAPSRPRKCRRRRPASRSGRSPCGRPV